VFGVLCLPEIRLAGKQRKSSDMGERLRVPSIAALHAMLLGGEAVVEMGHEWLPDGRLSLAIRIELDQVRGKEAMRRAVLYGAVPMGPPEAGRWPRVRHLRIHE
jgi:hypothetical protein